MTRPPKPRWKTARKRDTSSRHPLPDVRTSALPLFLVALPWLAAPHVAAKPTVRFDDLALVVQDGGQKVRLENALETVPIKHVVYAAVRRNDDFYLLLGLKEWTRGGPQPRGTCGGGKEESIQWLHVSGGKIVARQTGLYNSCGEERTGSVLGWKDGILLWHAHGERHPGPDGHAEFTPANFAWTFDSARPEAGIAEHMTPAAPATTPSPS